MALTKPSNHDPKAATDRCNVQALAVQLGANSCSCSRSIQSCPYLVNNKIINGGLNGDDQVNLNTDRVGRCRQAQATTAFTWFAFACFLGSLALSFMQWKRGGRK